MPQGATMAGSNDFLALYQELGLSADCTLEEFKFAYRKRVGALHPDRANGDADAGHGLPRLNALYTRAMEFQRRHGRLPGAAQPVTAPPTPLRTPSRPVATPPPDRARAAAASPRRSRMPLLLVLAAVLVVAWLWANPPVFESAAPERTASQRALGDAPDAPVPRTFELGTPAPRVRALQGAPFGSRDDHWDYGPSWVQFRCGVVSGWYSSPLRPLKVASARPPEAAASAPPRTCKE